MAHPQSLPQTAPGRRRNSFMSALNRALVIFLTLSLLWLAWALVWSFPRLSLTLLALVLLTALSES